MSRFIVIHQTPPRGTQEEIIAAARKVNESLVDKAQWLNSWLAGEAGELFCEWEAPDEDTVRASIEPVKELFPIVSVHLVTKIDPAWYK